MKSAISTQDWDQLCDIVINGILVLKDHCQQMDHRCVEMEKAIKLLRKNGTKPKTDRDKNKD